MFQPFESTLYGILVFTAAFKNTAQSIFNSGSAVSELIASLAGIMITVGLVIFMVVMALGLYAVFSSPERRAVISRRSLIIGGGIVVPVVVLFALLLHALMIADAIVAVDLPAVLRIEVTGERFWWRVSYLDDAGATDIVTANEIHLPVSQPVEFWVQSADVIHSFWVPGLAGKIDMIPGRTNRLRIVPDKIGEWRGQCAEYCGAQHRARRAENTGDPAGSA